MKYVVFVMLGAMGFIHARGQTAQGADGLSNMQGLSSGFGSFRTFDSRFKGVEGTPCLFENYLPGDVVMTTGEKISAPRLNYDAYHDDLLVATGKGEMIVKKERVQEFTIRDGNKSLHFVRLKQEEGEAFYQKLQDGPIELFKRPAKKIEAGSESSTYSASKTYSEFVREDIYSWRTDKGEMKILKNKKAILAAFSGHKKEIEQFIREEKVSFKDDEGLIRLFKFLNQLRSGEGA